MMHVTARQYAEALGVDTQTAYRRLQFLDYRNGRHAERFYLLARVLPTIKPRELKLMPRLFVVNADYKQTGKMGKMPLDAEELAARVEEWIDQRDSLHELAGPGKRIALVRRAFVTHVADTISPQFHTIFRNIEKLRRVVILDDEILEFILTGEKGRFPANFREWSGEFARKHAPQRMGEDLAA